MSDAPYPSLVSMATATVKHVTSHSVVRDIPDSNQTHRHAKRHTLVGFQCIKNRRRHHFSTKKRLFGKKQQLLFYEGDAEPSGA